MDAKRIAVIGGPLCGKSTFANSLVNQGYIHYCGDPISLVKRKSPNAIYLPENLDWSQSSDYIASVWFRKPEPWVIEGVSVVRALRKWSEYYSVLPCDRVIVFTNKYPSCDRLKGQDAMEKAIQTIWNEILTKYKGITQYKTWAVVDKHGRT